jgi:integrase/recombinase XerD
MYIQLYRRHNEDCRNRRCTCGTTETNSKGHKVHQKTCEGIDKHYRRCECSVWFETNENGKQRQWCSKENSWAAAERKARQLEERSNNGTVATPTAARTVKEAIELFLNNKRGENLAPDSLYRHEHITGLLLEFCNRQGIMFVKDITLAHLTTWRSQWTLKSPQARRSRQEKVKNFFKFCFKSGMIAANPAESLSAIKVRNDAMAVRPFEPKEYEAIIAAVSKTTMTDANKARTKAIMQLQRWSGLSLVDAVCLSKDELIQTDGKFRVRCDRQKTGTHINNVIPTWLGKELLTIKNGNPEYFFWSGTTTSEDAPSYFHKMYRKVFKLASIEGSSHDFRHTYAVELLKAGVDIRKVSKALGHSSIQTTERYYGKWNKAQQDIMDEELEKALNGKE